MATQCHRPGEELHTRGEVRRGAEPLVKEFRHTFTVIASTPKMRGLRAFLENNHYQFREECDANV